LPPIFEQGRRGTKFEGSGFPRDINESHDATE